MSLAAPLPRRGLPAIVAFLVVGFAILFLVPFHVPVPLSISDSYAFGFSNNAALVLFLAFAGAFAYWSGGLGLVVKQPEEAGGVKPMSRRLLGITLGVTVAITVSIWLVYRQYGAFDEATYQFDRLQQLAAGGVLYRGFEFFYGPIILYLPLMLHKLLHLSLLDAYFLSWTIEWLLGVYLLWLTVKWAGETTSRRDAIYLLCFLSCILWTLSMGTNYTPLRFIAGPFFSLLAWRLLEAGGSSLKVALVALVGTAFLLAYSPEQGIAFILGTLAFFVVFLMRNGRATWSAIAVYIVGSVAMLLVANHIGIFLTMRAATGGALNFPLLPSVSVILLLLVLLVSACVLLNSVRLNCVGPLEYLILISLFAMPAAFGRSDAGHLYSCVWGAHIAGWTVLSYHRRSERWMMWNFLLVIVLFLPIGLYQGNGIVMTPAKLALVDPSNQHPALRQFTLRLLNRAFGAAKTQQEIEKWSRSTPAVARDWNVPSTQPLFAPFGYPNNVEFATKLPVMEEGYFDGLGSVLQNYQVQQKIDELRARPDEMLLFDGEVRCAAPGPPPSPADEAQSNAVRRRQLWLNLQALYVPHARRSYDVDAPLCAYINAHYVPASYIAPFVGAEIWQPKDTMVARSPQSAEQ